MSARDLLYQRADDAISLGTGLETAATSDELGHIWADLTMVARALVQEEVDARDIAAVISRELRALTKRACQLAETAMIEAGFGGAPADYALLVLGSGGRGESLLAMDQDNAIIFAEGESGGAADQWFEELGRRIADTLNNAGVSYCKGGIMASNAAWRMDVAGWEKALQSWISRSKPEDILNCDIFFDAVAVHGAEELADKLRQNAMRLAQNTPSFLHLLAQNAGNFELPVGWFGRFKTDGGRIDLKMGGIMPVFSAARVVALTHGIKDRSTPERLEAFREIDHNVTEKIDNLIEAHRIMLGLILGQQLADIEVGLALSNKVAPAQLSGFERQELKWAIEQIPSVADLLGIPAGG